MINEKSTLEFHALRYINLPDKRNLYKLNLVRKDLASSINVDDKAIAILKRLQAGKSIKQTAKEVDFSVPVVMTIVKMFAQNNFVKTISGIPYDKNDFNEDSHIEFHKLKWSTKPDDFNLYGILRWDTDDSLRVDKEVIKIIQLLQEGKSIKEVAQSMNYSIVVLMAVIRMLGEAHFFKSIDGISLDDTTKKIKPLLPNLNRNLYSWLYNKPAAYFFAVFVLFGIILGIPHGGIPTYKNIFWTPDIFTVFVSLFVIGVLFTFFHEFFGHFLMTKVVGGQAVIRVNYRYLSLVGETESFHLALATKRQRYLVYLAGSFVDIIFIGIFYWAFFLMSYFHHPIEFLIKILPLAILAEILAIIWQFDAFLETDMYNFLTEYTGIENLRFDALKYIDLHTKKLNKVLLFPIKQLLLLFSSDYKNNSDDLRELSKNDKKKLIIYIFVLIAGLAFTTFQLLYYGLPRDITFISDSLKNITDGLNTNNALLILKSLIIIIYVIYEYLLILYFKIRDSKKNI